MRKGILSNNFIFLWGEWQFFDVPKGILLALKNFLKFNLNYFSLSVLLQTFFAPWHRYRIPYGRRIELWYFFEAFVFNLMSRIFGAFFRLFFIILGLSAEVFIAFVGLIIFVGWLVVPLILTLGPLFLLLAISSGSILAGIGFLAILLICAFFYVRAFFNQKLKAPRDSFSFAAANAIAKAEGDSLKLFYFLINDNQKLNFIFLRALLDLSEIKNILLSQMKLPNRDRPTRDNFQNTISEAKKIAQSKGKNIVGVGDILAALAKHNSIFQQILLKSNLSAKDIENVVKLQDYLEKKVAERKKFWEWKNLLKQGSLARNWTAGYTPTLNTFSVDITQQLKIRGFPEVIGHQAEINAMERILSQKETKNSVLIVGEPGSGRKSMIFALATKSALGQCLPELNYKRFVQLDLKSLLAQTEPEQTESILDTIFREVTSAGNIILVIDEFHHFVSGAIRPGVLDISGELVPYLQSPDFQLVAITTFEGLHKNIEQNSQLLAFFEKVEVSEISQEETFILLERLSLVLERKYKIFVSYPALRDIIKYSAKYLPAIPFPEKALDLLESAVVLAYQMKESVLLPKHIAKVVRKKTQIPVGELEIKEKEILLNLEDLIHQRIINQNEAVKEVAGALRRARADVSQRVGPMGVFLFLGPTGVGKTETAKALAEIYFGSEKGMIRLDMSEFQNIGDITRLIGAPGQEGLLTTPLREDPFSLILLDELEKAHKNILNLFLQVFDEGHLTDGQGRKVSFQNSIIIATSNAAYQVILKVIKQNIEWSQVKEKILNHLFQKGIFRPEFINRFDAVVIFRPLSKESLLSIAELLLQKLNKNLKEKGIELIITPELKEKIVELGYNPIFGAREMRRVIQEKVENTLANAILSKRLTRGSKATIDPQTFQLKINK